MELIRPTEAHLPGFLDALRRDWDWTRDSGRTAQEEVDRVLADPARFLALMDDRAAEGGPVEIAPGITVPRLPSITRWMWDGEFAGQISLRWQHGTPELPPTCLGHIGYGVVPWKRRRGYATAALRQVLPLAAAEGLPYVEITCDPDNEASRRVIEANGAGPAELFDKLPVHGGGPGLRFRIDLSRWRAAPSGATLEG
jgi:predicted acetyltransferase